MHKGKILVTGATGMVGRSLINDLLLKNANFIAVAYENPKDIFFDKIDLRIGSLLDIDFLEDILLEVKYIYHCDDFFSYHASEHDKLYTINVKCTENLVNLAIAAKVEKLLYLSSSQTFGTHFKQQTITEETKWVDDKCNTYYSICKKRAELEVKRGQEEGLQTVIVNPSIIISNTINQKTDFYALAKANYSYYPDGIYGFVCVEDVAEICISLMEKDINGEQFIINAENLNYREVVKQLFPNRKTSYFQRMNPLKAQIIWRINYIRNWFTGAKPYLTKQWLQFDNRDHFFDNTKVVNALSFSFKPITTCAKRLETTENE